MKAKTAGLGKKGGRKARRIVQIVFFVIVAVTGHGGSAQGKGDHDSHHTRSFPPLDLPFRGSRQYLAVAERGDSGQEGA